MSDTPETDAALYPMNGVDIVWPEFSRQLERDRDEARAELTNIYRWIERNHSDGSIDSLSYSQNLERVTDSWYDRLERVERERDEAREVFKEMWRSGDAFLPHVDAETINRWRKAAGWEETK
jgi:hypothetical protein